MDINEFQSKLKQAIVNELKFWRRRLSSDQIQAFNLGCYPWHGYLELSFLTMNEDHEELEYPKHSMGDWRWYDFTSTYNDKWSQAKELAQWSNDFYENSADDSATELLFETCAKVLISKEIIEELKKYNLTEAFEVSVYNNDDPIPQENYCSKYNPKF